MALSPCIMPIGDGDTGLTELGDEYCCKYLKKVLTVWDIIKTVILL